MTQEIFVAWDEEYLDEDLPEQVHVEAWVEVVQSAYDAHNLAGVLESVACYEFKVRDLDVWESITEECQDLTVFIKTRRPELWAKLCELAKKEAAHC